MGTRGITIVKANNKILISKYNQWDSYPNGNGNKLLTVLRTYSKDTILKAVNRIKKITKKEIDHVNTFNKQISVQKYNYTTTQVEWAVKYPWLSRDWHGCEVIQYLCDNPTEKISMLFDLNFPSDSLFCAWGYVIDFDTSELPHPQGVGLPNSS